MAIKKENNKGPYNNWASEMRRKVMPVEVSRAYFMALETEGEDKADEIVESFRKTHSSKKAQETLEKQM